MFCPADMPQRPLKQLVSISNLIGSSPPSAMWNLPATGFPIHLMSEEDKKDHLLACTVCFPVPFHGITTMIQIPANVLLGLGSIKFR